MAFFPDLTQYTYGANGYPDAGNVGCVNVGWLSAKEPMATGDVPDGFVARLAELVLQPVNLYRGWHTCELCTRARGNGEIRVEAGPVTYVAPGMVLHYIAAHGYRPPQEFIEAVLESAAR